MTTERDRPRGSRNDVRPSRPNTTPKRRAYDDHPYPATSHAAFVRRLLETCPAGGTVLDAPCGTGAYFEHRPGVGPAGGRDRSVSGHARAGACQGQSRARLEQVGLQELTFDAEFDGAMTIDAMENIPPEDWPGVLANLHRADPSRRPPLPDDRDGGRQRDRCGVRRARRPGPAGRARRDHRGRHRRLPLLPRPEQVCRWLDAEGLDVVDEGYDQEDGWGYRHLLLRSRR